MHLITVAQAMILASATKSEWNGIFRNTAGIFFLGTPHRGSSSANEAAAYFRLIPLAKTPPLISLLCKNSSLLVQTAEQFSNIWGSRRIFSFCETSPMFGLRMVIHHSAFLRHLSQNSYCQVVPRKDAIANCQAEQIYDIPNCDHTEITKPESTQSDLFTKFLCAIMLLLRQDLSTSVLM
jgi:hypothetical protein